MVSSSGDPPLGTVLTKFFFSGHLGLFKIGKLCAVRHRLGEGSKKMYYRGEMVELVNEEKEKILVKLIDIGVYVQTSLKYTFELPDTETCRQPPLGVTIHVLGILPCDFDFTWTLEAQQHFASFLQQELKLNQRWTGAVRFAIGSHLLLDGIKIEEYLPDSQIYTTEFELKEAILDARFAVEFPEHLPRLVSLCEGTGISEIPRVVTRKGIATPSWAHFDGEITSVVFGSMISMKTIFLKNAKFRKQLTDLEKECAVEGERQLAMKKKLKFSVGDICLAKNLFDDGWNRGRVFSISADVLCVFFVDHGDHQNIPTSRCVQITQQLITKLPFQIVECFLGGISNSDPDSDVICDRLQMDFMGDGSEECFVAWKKSGNKPECSGGSLYVVNLLSREGKSLNKILVDEKLDQAVEGGEEFLTDIDILLPGEGGEIESSGDENDKTEENDGKTEDKTAESYTFDPSKCVFGDDVDDDEQGEKVDSSIRDPQKEENNDRSLEMASAGSDRSKSFLAEEDKTEETDLFDISKDGGEGIVDEEENSSSHDSEKRDAKDFANGSREVPEASEDTSDEPDDLKLVNSSISLPWNSTSGAYMTKLRCDVHPSPKVLWSQNSKVIQLKLVFLHEVEESSVKVWTTGSTVRVECATKNGTVYITFYKLWGVIFSKSFCKLVTPLMVRLRFSKIPYSSGEWPRLLLKTEKPATLSGDPDPITEEDKNAFQRVAERSNMYFDYDSDDSNFYMPDDD